MILFGCFAKGRKAIYGERPETFDFLGFTHVCGADRNGKSPDPYDPADPYDLIDGTLEGCVFAADLTDQSAGFFRLFHTDPATGRLSNALMFALLDEEYTVSRSKTAGLLSPGPSTSPKTPLF